MKAKQDKWEKKLDPHNHPFQPDPKDGACKLCGCLEGTHGKDKSMTQELSDEGLREMAGKIAFHYEDLAVNIENLTMDILTALKQVRRETREECAKLAEDYGNSLIPIIKTQAKSNTPYHLKSQGTAKGCAIGAERIATAIRALEGR